MRVARPVVLSPEQREALEARARARSASLRSVERARIVLMAGSGPRGPLENRPMRGASKPANGR